MHKDASKAFLHVVENVVRSADVYSGRQVDLIRRIFISVVACCLWTLAINVEIRLPTYQRNIVVGTNQHGGSLHAGGASAGGGATAF